jgi:hypothetical protein
MSSVNKTKYITHIAHLSTAAILQQAGIERCPKSGMQILTDLLICYIKMLGDRIGSASTMLTHRSPRAEFTDAILLLHTEYGSSPQSLLWADLMHFLDRQKFIPSIAVPNGPSLLTVLWGLPLRLDIEGKTCNSTQINSHSSTALNGEDEFLYHFLPPFPQNPTVKSCSSSMPKAPSNVQDVEMKIVEFQNPPSIAPSTTTLLQAWEWEEVESLEIDPALGLGLMQIDSDSRSLLEQNPCSVIPNNVTDPPGRLAIGTLDKPRIGVQRLWRQPLWISGECQVIQFLKEPTQADSREPVIVQSACALGGGNVVETVSNGGNPSKLQLKINLSK